MIFHTFITRRIVIFLFGITLIGCQESDSPPCKEQKTSPVATLTDSLSKKLNWPRDLTIRAFTGPELTPSPAALAVKPTGEVFVGVDKQGSLGNEIGKGAIVRLVDCNRDGIPDSHTEFTKVNNPRGIIAMGDKVFVLHTTFSEETGKASGMDLVVYEDKDGDAGWRTDLRVR